MRVAGLGASPNPNATAATQTPGQSSGEPAGVSAEVSPWESFVLAKSSDEFCRAWLALICTQIVGVCAAAVLVEDGLAQRFVPLAAWPETAPDMARLSAVVQRALTEKRGIVQPEVKDAVRSTHIAYPVLMGSRVGAVVALDMSGLDEDVQLALRHIHWASAWLTNMFSQRELDLATQGQERLGSVLEIVVSALRHAKFQQALFEVANQLRQRFKASRVAIGLAEHALVKVTALSEAATFERHSPMVKAYSRAMDEAFDHGAPLSASALIRTPTEATSQQAASPQHHALLACSGASHVLSYPLLLGARCLGVLLIEQDGDGFTAADMIWLDAFAALLTPIIAQRKAAEAGVLARLSAQSQSLLEKLFGPRHLVWKASASLMLLIFSLLLLVSLPYRVTAKTVIEGEVQRVSAAPFEGFIAASFVRAGDSVKTGQLLAQLDDRDLKIEQLRWASEGEQYDNKLREAMANGDMTGVQVIGAQLRQSQAQLALVSAKIERAQLIAPYAGLVVSGDLSQQIGAPVETGKKLFEIAPLQRYRIILQVDEREIRHVSVGQVGQIVMTGIASDAMPLSVLKVTPVASAQDGKNFFRVEASLDRVPDHLRPGMEGVGKIEVGSRRLWWILTHSLTDWLSLSLWTWML
ncbi:hypothetical protein HC248_01320 [Polaromonas vacuolata]|uniref:GAF domain-containing protein n=1 Tax=Polaromonas vacuolata TaxID=37448 RepID=A0A6H2H976_9BURK|nr:HlyD family efflux transporter periplasmic adaptor subunit [Polaromonas vacuolata]QJC56036.1 hypothetical protein HC248_01320 [Polaromonas vacuolata]